MRPSFMSFLPEQRLGSQWPRSQQAALKAGRERVVVEEEGRVGSSLLGLDSGRLEWRGGPR